MSNTQITFIDKNSSQVVYKASEVNDAIAFNENVDKGQIRFPHLSKYINDYYVAQHYTIANFESKSEIQSRLAMWNDLQIINFKEAPILVNNEASTKLKIESINARSGLTGFEKDDIVEVNLLFKNKFKSIDQIREIADQETDNSKKLVLNDLISFYEYYNETLKSAYSNLNNDEEVFQKMWDLNYSNFGKYLSLHLNNDKSMITLVPEEVETREDGDGVANISNSIFQTYIFNNYFAPSVQKTTTCCLVQVEMMANMQKTKLQKLN